MDTLKCFSVVVLLLMTVGLCLAAQQEVTVQSPDGHIQLTVRCDEATGGQIRYSVLCDGKPMIIDSHLGLKLVDIPAFNNGFNIMDVELDQVNNVWKPVYGQWSEIPDRYRQASISLQTTDSAGYQMILTMRAYDEGIAFRYEIPAQKGLSDFVIEREYTEFNFMADHACWATPRAQKVYQRVTLNTIDGQCERPLTIKTADGRFMAIAEAALVDYARTNIKSNPDKTYSILTNLGSSVKASGSLTTPWRVAMLAETAGELLENSHLLLNLNKPCELLDTTWIKPGKVIREGTLTTQGGIACVDFAVKHNLQYIEFDAGWYGPENNENSDATTITLDPKRSKGPLDLQRVIDYANKKDIGVILYVNRRALEKQLDEILPLYQKWGVAGLKYGFVNVGSQKWTTWLHEAVRKAAKYQMMVDIHDEYRPTGYSRTYPNLMTQEGIRGDEESPSNAHSLKTLFTRMVAGAADNTICYFAPRVDDMGSSASQLAKAVCFYSPWQFVYWYDCPTGSPKAKGPSKSRNNFIAEVPDLEFFDRVPTVWDDTKVLHGEIGKYATIARRSGDTWFVGTINGTADYELTLPLSFLSPGQKYKATIFSDDRRSPAPTYVRVDKKMVDKDTVLKASIRANNGQAIIFDPILN